MDFDTALRKASDAILVLAGDFEGEGPRIAFASEGLLDLTGYGPDQLHGKPLTMLVDQPSRKNQLARLFQDASTAATARSNLVLRRYDESTVRVEFQLSPLLESAGQSAYSVAVLRNPVERQNIRCHLEDLVSTIDTVQNVLPVGTWVAEQGDSRIMRCSPRMLEMFGLTAQELSQCPDAFFSRFHPEDRDRVGRTIRTAMLERKGYDIQHRVVLPGGTVRWLHARATPIEGSSESPFRLVGVVFDITERVATHTSLRVAEQRFQAAAEASQDGLALLRSCRDPQGRIRDFEFIEVNHRATQLFAKERTALVQQTLGDMLPGPEKLGYLRRFVEVVETGSPLQQVVCGDSIGVPSSWIHLQVVPLADGVAVSLRDISRERALTRELSQAKRLESIGRLAVGIAHDFNNMLSAILGFGGLARDALPVSAQARGDIEQALRAAGRATQLTRYLLALGSRQALEPKVVDVARALNDLAPILSRLAGTEIELLLELDANSQTAWIDPCQFEQAIVNIVANARDAMPNGGSLRIRSELVSLPDVAVDCAKGGSPAKHVCISLQDTGTGMDEATRAQIFEPFFTTKGPGAGTGMGLASVYGFVKQSEGHISVDSEVGRGTVVRLYFPQAAVARRQSSTPAPRISGSFARGTESVLLVESDESVRSVARRILDLHGYVVREATNADEAEAVLKDLPNGVDVLLAALRLPQVSGVELARRVAQRSCATRIVIMSGAADSCIIEAASEELGARFLQKPFTLESLVNSIQESLLMSQSSRESPEGLQGG
jgi:two-component system, cell cycle sensor histidine kinase and response regulator CckA